MTSRGILASVMLALAPLGVTAARPTAVPTIDASGLRIELTGRPAALWRFAPTSAAPAHDFAAPVFPLDGRLVAAVPVGLERVGEPIPLGPDVLEHRFRGVLRDDASLWLELRFRLSDLAPFVRLQYVLGATKPHAFSRRGAQDELTYLAASFTGLPRVREVRLAESGAPGHGATLSERPVVPDAFRAGRSVPGPILLASDGRRTLLVGYEHGSPSADALVRFELGEERSLRLRAVQGNYLRGERLDAEHPFETVWLQAGLVAGDEDRTAEAYRRFAASELVPEGAVAPRALYDLGALNGARVLEEIEVAHRMGIETFVLGRDWCEKTGDWTVNRARLPEGLAPIRRQLDAHGMMLGLRLDPSVAAVSSRAYLANRAYALTTGRRSSARGTAQSARLCLVSPWGEAFLEQLVRLAKETGARHFRWDAVGPQRCDAPGHGHGTQANTPAERRAAYAFQVPLRLAALARRLGDQVPGAVVDFDVSEPGAGVGLALLTAGRFLLANDGPYDPYAYDRWLPSPLFRPHELPHDFEESPFLGSLILGHGGIGGDLLAVPEARVARVARILGLWRQVRDAIAAASPVHVAGVAGSGQVHEKIDHESGRGAIVVFSTVAGRERYVSEHPAAGEHWATPGTNVSYDAAGHAVLDMAFARPGAAIVLFGVRERQPQPATAALP